MNINRFIPILAILSGIAVCSIKAQNKATIPGAPIGSIIAFAGPEDKIPEGWIPCHGQSLNKTEYPRLFNTIGQIWGNASGHPDTFNAPNLQGLFLRGVDMETRKDKLTDPDKASRKNSYGKTVGSGIIPVGTIQDDALQAHTHEDPGHNHGTNMANNSKGLGEGPHWTTRGMGNHKTTKEKSNIGEATGSSQGAVRTSKETRPKNAYVYFIIKARI
ncbi:MAG: tail fiber protein [Opitutales bacterium]